MAATIVDLLFDATEVSGTATGNTLISNDSIPESQFLYPLYVDIQLQDVAGLLTPPTISIGTNSPNYNNLMPTTALLGLTQENNILRVWLSGVMTSVPWDADVYARISIGAIASTYTIGVLFKGYLLSWES